MSDYFLANGGYLFPLIIFNFATENAKLGFRAPPVKTIKKGKILKNQYVLTVYLVCLLKMRGNKLGYVESVLVFSQC